jgi:hypothetical protein
VRRQAAALPGDAADQGVMLLVGTHRRVVRRLELRRLLLERSSALAFEVISPQTEPGR